MSLGLMAFATASTITYAGALFTTALATPDCLGERVGWVQLGGGFGRLCIGVIMVVQPGGVQAFRSMRCCRLRRQRVMPSLGSLLACLTMMPQAL